MTKKIYELYDKATATLSSKLIINDRGNLIAKAVWKYPKYGAGRVWCYLHFFGHEMQRGSAGGYGYDKTVASLEAAADHVYANDAYDNHDVDLVRALLNLQGRNCGLFG